jgi:hypothetical protein
VPERTEGRESPEGPRGFFGEARLYLTGPRIAIAIAIVVGCFAVSFGAVLLTAAWCWDPQNAGSGGALGTILSLGVLFTSALQPDRKFTSLGIDVLRVRNLLSAASEVERTFDERVIECEKQLSILVDALNSYIVTAGRETFIQNLLLSIAAGLSTFFWGFGTQMVPLLRTVLKVTCS